MTLPQGDDKVVAVRKMFDAIAPRYDLTNKVLTFGLDIVWRRRSMSRLRLGPGSSVVDVACGCGDYCRLLTAAGHRAIGVDLSFVMLDNARTPVPLVQGDALELPFADASVDGMTSGFALRNFAGLDHFFAECARVVRPGGRVMFLDAYQPDGRLVGAVHGFYFNTVVPRIGGLIGNDASAYAYLPRSLEYLPPIDVMLATLGGAGFTEVTRETFTFGTVHLITATRL